MNPSGPEVKEALEKIKELYKIVNQCQHEIEGSENAFAKCKWCKKIFGWWCPNSPDNQCDYIHPGGSEKYPDSRYDEDNCIHCHNPNERK